MLYRWTRVLTRVFTYIIGYGLLAVVFFLAAEILCRKFLDISLPGSHEYSGYFLAILSSWGLSLALLRKAHIRIDIAYQTLAQPVQRLLDVVASAAMCFMALIIAWFAWPVLQNSLNQQALSNTPLQTPMWIPQAMWFAGLLWFAWVSTISLLYTLWMLMTKHAELAAQATGMASELEQAKGEC